MGVRFWELATLQSSLWAEWMKKRYFRNGSVWTASAPSSGSSPWRKILLSATWIRNQWMKPDRWPSEYDSLWEEIEQMDVGGLGKDILIWKGEKTGTVTYQAAWNYVRSIKPQQDWTKALWNSSQPPRWSFLCWQAALNRLPTLDRLWKRQIVQSSQCALCSAEEEVGALRMKKHRLWCVHHQASIPSAVNGRCGRDMGSPIAGPSHSTVDVNRTRLFAMNP
ncbi:hypothetical protein QJS10_CPB22g00803 [Acorus calamus]|uniref:Reverse transcriptase zinc-binding domain-containing protein n=1 Tax=Acorus calamus TaxID=4465 RepID=A0AAV9C2T0_ACOCL|nr:hypothetical protein QJS10_CPB22g00803 [Acorus calamus]